MKPSEEEIKQEQARQDSTELLSQNEAASSDSLDVLDEGEADSVQNGFEATAQNEEGFVLENDKLIIKVSNKGGSVKSVQVKGEKTFDGDSVFLFNGENNKYGFLFRTDNQNISTSNLYFQNTSEGEGNTLNLRTPYED